MSEHSDKLKEEAMSSKPVVRLAELSDEELILADKILSVINERMKPATGRTLGWLMGYLEGLYDFEKIFEMQPRQLSQKIRSYLLNSLAGKVVI